MAQLFPVQSFQPAKRTPKHPMVSSQDALNDLKCKSPKLDKAGKKKHVTQQGVSKNNFSPPNHSFVHRVFHYFHHPFWGFSPYFLVQHPTSRSKRGLFNDQKGSMIWFDLVSRFTNLASRVNHELRVLFEGVLFPQVVSRPEVFFCNFSTAPKFNIIP